MKLCVNIKNLVNYIIYKEDVEVKMEDTMVSLLLECGAEKGSSVDAQVRFFSRWEDVPKSKRDFAKRYSQSSKHKALFEKPKSAQAAKRETPGWREGELDSV